MMKMVFHLMMNGGNFLMNPNKKPDHASWGHFEEGPESGQWGDIDNSPTKHEIADDRTKDSKVRDIESGDLSDDKFGDFG
jgi:hypothetical protein